MPSPFPGMDPYLEDPALWFDFRCSFAVEISRHLNRDLPRPYHAFTERREIDVSGERGMNIRSIDVEVRCADRSGEVATAFEIADAVDHRCRTNGATLSEVRSPILNDGANLIQIFLRSSHERSFGRPACREKVAKRPGRYFVRVVRRTALRREAVGEVHPFGLKEELPTIAVPLREGDAVLNLQSVFDRVYDRGPYAIGAVDYGESPRTPLTADELAWVRERVAAAFPSATEERP